MPRTRKPRPTEANIVGLKYFRKIMPLFRRLHEVGTERDKAGNRQLFFDHYCTYLLLFFFNPIIDSLRGMQKASELKKVQKKLGCPRVSLGSLSEATEIFDPEPLRRIVQELAGELPPAQDPDFPEIKQLLTAVDGSVVRTFSNIVQAAYLKSPTGGRSKSAYRLHTHFDIERGVPLRIDVTGGCNSGADDEREVLRKHLQPDHCYVMDRGYAKFALFNAIAAIGSSYVCRLRDNSNYEVVEERPLSAEAKAAGIVFDGIVLLGQDRDEHNRPNHKMRLLLIRTTPHQKRGGSSGAVSDGLLRIATNLLDPPTEIIGFIYQKRWLIEVFFRFLKHMLGCRHLLSTDQKGVQIQAYCAIIACLLLALWTGKKPTKRTFEMFCWYFIGWADEDELASHLEKLQAQTR